MGREKSMSKTVLELQEITKSFSGTPVLNGISLKAEHYPADYRGAGDAGFRQGAAVRQRYDGHGAQQAGREYRISELCPVPSYERGAEYRLQPENT